VVEHVESYALVGAASVLIGGGIVLLWQNLRTDARLFGTWQSDGERTVNEWRERRPLTDEQADKLRQLFGHMRITWGRRSYSTLMDGVRVERSYRVIAADEKSIVLRAWDGLNRRDEFVTVNFDDADTYWLYAGGGPLREYFRRVG
jgi:hypothetical protein